MKMNNFNLSFFLAILVTIIRPSFAGETALEFKGKLIADPCQVSADSDYQTVEFGTIVSKTFINHNRTSPKRFKIHLEECDLELGNSVKIKFTGDEDSQQLNTFKVSGDAAGIAIAIEDEHGSTVKPDEYMSPVKLNEGDMILNWNAYVQSGDYQKIKEGSFESSVTFHLEYE